MTKDFGPLVDAGWLIENLAEGDVRIIDATWYAPIDDKDARAEFAAGHIPGAIYVDISDVRDPAHPAPHMLPPADLFADYMGKAGVGSDCRIVVYDNGEYAATRLWWMFRALGHDAVAMLDGGLAAWKQAGGTLETDTRTTAPAEFRAAARPELVRSMSEMRANIDAESGARAQVVDARQPARFAGELPEMRPGLESGHIPGSVNLHYIHLIDSETGMFGPPAGIGWAFRDRGIDPERPHRGNLRIRCERLSSGARALPDRPPRCAGL